MAQTGRRYDYALVEAIAQRSFTTQLDGIVEEVRAIPDDDREHVLDPRQLETARKKLAGLIPSSSKAGVMGQRRLPKDNCLFHETNVAEETRVIDFGDRGIPVYILTPEDHKPGSPVVVYLHGGCFTGGWYGYYTPFLMRLCELSGAVIVFPEVRLAPENPYPAQMDDAADTVGWVIEHADELGVDASKLVVAGDSAGGCLTNATVRRRPDDVALCFPLYPGVDFTIDPDYWTWDQYPMDESQVKECTARVETLHSWIPDEAFMRGNAELRKNPEISALLADDLSYFPRTVVVCCEWDYLRLQDERFAKKLASQGVDVRLIRYKGMDHGFIEIAGTVPQAEDLAILMAEEIQKL